MSEHLEIEEDHVPRLCLELYREHGTTMAGLKAKRNPSLIFNIIYVKLCSFSEIFHGNVGSDRLWAMNLTMMSSMLMCMEDCLMTTSNRIQY